MKIAVTADTHLTDKNEYPERYNSLNNILDKLSSEGINTLIIAGDLFDESYQNYSEFDEITATYDNIDFHIVPSNHDLTYNLYVLPPSSSWKIPCSTYATIYRKNNSCNPFCLIRS